MIPRKTAKDDPDQVTAEERTLHRVAKARAEALADLARVREWVTALRLLMGAAPAAAGGGLREIQEAISRLAGEFTR
jgi:hypothetical protein